MLTNGGFSSIGHADYRDESIAAKIRVFSLPLRLPLETGLVGPIELRLAAGYGEASTTGAQRPAGATGPASGGPERERQFVSLRNLRFDIGRPVSLAPGLVLTPLLGVGAQHWSGKIDGIPAGGGPAPTGRVTFWTDALLTEAGAILEHRRRWGAVTLRPGASVSYIRLYDLDGRATQTEPVPARGRAKIAADSTVLRAAVRADAPLLGWRIGRRDLRWQVFVVGNYNTASVGLFPWSVETGAAVGAELGKLDRAMGGFDLGEFYVGASYIVGENFSGVRANLGFRF